MKDSIFLEADIVTPCYVYDLAAVQAALARIGDAAAIAGCKFLYSIKSASNVELLKFIRPYVAGFSCSSLFELRLARELATGGQTLHITTPGYRADEFEQIVSLADYLSFNSVSQWHRLANTASQHTSCGLRMNPELSLVKDIRYDPCREHSKLGITAAQLQAAVDAGDLSMQEVHGIAVHNNCEATDLNELSLTVNKMLDLLSVHAIEPTWFNLGGGYLWQDGVNGEILTHICEAIRQRYQADIFIEPGKAVVGHSGYLLARVIDIIEQPVKSVAVLDTCINHLPEVFEYQYQPVVANSMHGGEYVYRLAGSSCLSGDLFGDYSFQEPLEIGSRVLFRNVGAYMQVKANLFNGINLPTSYLFDGQAGFEMISEHNYADFRRRL